MTVFKSVYRLTMVIAATLTLVSTTDTVRAADQADDFIRVFMNHARVLKLDRPVAKVIIGNSEVADATVADAKTIVLTGRSFGTTNLVLLDNAGNAIVDERVLVSIDEGDTVRVYRQTERSVYSCTPNCEKNADTSGGGGSSASASSGGSSSSSMSTVAN